ncbi:lytic polysaccharide monooxygenase [Nocardia iowensis]|uniref:lytic polysaccharide monooxygenase n=1 Tax=Nocardia iowensis TaxID=204891 RepID=UPI001FE93F06|nr:lytic polysaccharide monooxygenase [Nocardia iowensis]
MAVLFPAGTAGAHGYVSSPASRQAQCAAGTVACGPIKYEPQSVEGPKGLRNCHGNNAQFAELNDDSKPWKVHAVGNSASFTWTNTARHRTANWEYYIGNTRVTLVPGNNQQPDRTVTHTVNFGNFTGRQKLLAIWNIGDTANAFYACVDLQIGGGSTPTTTPSPTTTVPPTTTTVPPTTTTTPPTTTPPGSQEWAPGRSYQVGSEVTYDGARYRCLQSHTANPGWEPANTPALWQKL